MVAGTAPRYADAVAAAEVLSPVTGYAIRNEASWPARVVTLKDELAALASRCRDPARC